MLCLSVPVFAGHTIGGGWCACGTDPGYCFCDPGEEPRGMSNDVSDKSSQEIPTDLGSETLLALAALFLVLRYKA